MFSDQEREVHKRSGKCYSVVRVQQEREVSPNLKWFVVFREIKMSVEFQFGLITQTQKIPPKNLEKASITNLR
jgi:hypothetical protein